MFFGQEHLVVRHMEKRVPTTHFTVASFLVTGFVLASLRADALDENRTLAQLHHTAWTAKDGAPSQVNALAQTSDGFLWIGTSRGLFRFDGVVFERYSPPDDVTLPGHNIYALLATKDGGLWISFRPRGLGFLRDGVMRVFTRPEDLPTSQVYFFATDQDGRVWAGAHDGLALYSGSGWSEIGTDWKLPRGRIWSLLSARDGTLWVCVGPELWRLERGSRSFESTGLTTAGVKRMTQAPDGTVWISMLSGPTRHLVRSHGTWMLDSAGLRLDPQDMLFDRDGTLWLTDSPQGIRRIRSPEQVVQKFFDAADPLIDSFQSLDGLSGNGAVQLLEDHEGSIWVGTAHGLDRFRSSRIVPLRLPPEHHSMTLVAGDAGDLWVGSSVNQKLIHVRDDQVVVHPAPLALSALRESRGAILWGSIGSVWRQRGTRIDVFPQPRDLYSGPTPQSECMWEIVRGDDGAFWVGYGDLGLIHFKDGAFTRQSPPAGLTTRGPSATYHDSEGRIWFGYSVGAVAVFDRNRVTRYSREDGLDIGRIRVIRGRGPAYWFGGELGLAVFREGKFRSVLHSMGERFGTVSGIVETADGTLWLNEMNGVVRISADEAQRAAADPNHRVAFELFDFRDGLPGSPQMNFTVSTAVETTDGRLWFATDNGLARVDSFPADTNAVPPPIVIRSISTESKTYEPASDLRLPKKPASVRIDYTALSLAIPERVQFRYRLEGYDADWRDAGNLRSAFYTRLRPGRYRFQVVASNNDGVWNMTGATTQFSVAPAFYQTHWFTAATIAAILGVMWLAYRLRVRQIATRLRRLHDERAAERMRIAHELHDTLLQGFLSASMQLNMAAETIPEEVPAKSKLSRVQELMNHVIVDARDAVRGLRNSSDTQAPDLEQALARLHQEFADSPVVDFRVVTVGRQQPLQPASRDEAYRIGRESIVNAFRHAAARTIKTEISYLPDALRVVVRDDGRGIDPNVLRDGREGHWGLSGMRERAQDMGGRLTVRSRLGSGTEVELVIPGRIAFSDPRPSNAALRAARWLRECLVQRASKEG